MTLNNRDRNGGKGTEMGTDRNAEMGSNLKGVLPKAI
jgi:hypothetical protein